MNNELQILQYETLHDILYIVCRMLNKKVYVGFLIYNLLYIIKLYI